MLKKSFQQCQLISDEPLIYVFDDFLSSEECDHIISLAKDSMKPSILGDPRDPKYSEFRTGNTFWLEKDKTQMSEDITERVARLLEIPSSHAENFQVINYEVGQEYKPHLDAFDLDSKLGKNHFQRGGQRIATTLMYLCDVEEGGETVFPKLGAKVAPKKGRLCVFYNCFYDDLKKRHPKSLHGGSPVIKGKKWACNLWFHERIWSK